MASEIRISAAATVRNGNLRFDWNPGTIILDQSAALMSGGSQTIGGTTPEVIVLTDIATAGVTFFTNLNTSLTIEVGTGTGTSFVALLSLKPNEIALGRLATTQPTARVTTASNANLYAVMLSN